VKTRNFRRLPSLSNPNFFFLTRSQRVVLLIDFWHPELTSVEREALQFIYDLRNKFESGEVPLRTEPNFLERLFVKK